MTRILKTCVASAMLVVIAGAASAATLVYQDSGNLPINEDLVIANLGIDTPGLAKCDTETNGASPVTCSKWEDGTAVGEYDAAFDLTYTGGSGGYSFSWSFDPGAVSGTSSVLSPHYVLVKQANSQFVYELDASEYLGSTIFTGLNDISHVTFYNTGMSAVPLPAAGWMLLAGVGGLAAYKRRKKA